MKSKQNPTLGVIDIAKHKTKLCFIKENTIIKTCMEVVNVSVPVVASIFERIMSFSL